MAHDGGEPDAGPEILSLRGLAKRFTGTVALDGVDFDVRAGEVHALLGENGAGKSTLIKILAGVYRADQGTFAFRGQPVDPQRDKLPITFIHQDLGLVDTMTAAENVAILTGYPRSRGIIDWRRTREAAAALLARMGGGIEPDVRVGDLPAAGKSIVAIARALAVECSILVLDEPTAALPEADVERLLEVLRRLRSEGLGIVYVTHRLDEVFRIADRVTVLRDGRKVATRPVAGTSPGALVEAIIGRKLEEMFVRPAAADGEPILYVDELVTRHIGPVSFTLSPGEIVGLVGLRGAGHDIVGRAIFGDAPIASGVIRFDGQALRGNSVRDAAARRIGFVSSKRREESIAAGLSVRENLFMNPVMLGAGVVSPIGPGEERERCDRVLRRLSVRPADTETPVATLSGGNQQKVVVSRWIEADCRLLILEEPTLGVDVGSKAQIYQLLQASSDARRGALLVSSDFEEVAGICHRALIFNRGRVVAELSRDELSIARLTALSSGAGQHASTQ
jgi:ribose transport system ATP-binding protein